eukprot:COSAG06_NODE_68678_length_209_cov_28.690909_1_plen_45_part_10
MNCDPYLLTRSRRVHWDAGRGRKRLARVAPLAPARRPRYSSSDEL